MLNSIIETKLLDKIKVVLYINSLYPKIVLQILIPSRGTINKSSDFIAG